MSRDINKLREPFRASIKELVKRAKAAGLPVIVTSTTRTLAEQKELVRNGYSKTLKSKHLTGHAADLAFQTRGKLSYEPKLYERLYTIIKDLPFVIWPYRDLKWGWDWSHTQYDKDKVGKIVHNANMNKECEKKIKELNTEIGKTTRERDEARKALAQEKHSNQETLDKYRSCQREREALREGKRGILDKIKALFKG